MNSVRMSIKKSVITWRNKNNRDYCLKKYKTVEIETQELVSMTCDCCGVLSKNPMDTADWLSWHDRCGYGNIHFGDLNEVQLDLCQVCTFELLGKYVKVTEHDTL